MVQGNIFFSRILFQTIVKLSSKTTVKIKRGDKLVIETFTIVSYSKL